MSTVRTVTLSPGFDHLVVVDALVPGGTSNVVSWTTQAAGKGVNAARVLHRLGTSTVAYSLVGESDRTRFEAALESDGIGHVTVGVPRHTRDNITLSIQGSSEIAAHAAGARLSEVPEGAINALFERLMQDVRPDDIVTFNGSLPTGTDPSVWGRWVRPIRERGALVVVDTHGPALMDVLRTGGIHAVMPNADEVADLDGLAEIDDVVARASRALALLDGLGVPNPVVTLGELGVLHLVERQIVRSCCPVESARVVVGAGDAFLAGYCAALLGDQWGAEPVVAGLAAAAAHVGGAGRADFAAATRGALLRIVSGPVSA